MLSQPLFLVSTDFSKFSDEALKMASELQKKTNGRIHVLHFVEYPLQWDWVDEEVRQTFLHEESNQNFMDQMQRYMDEQLSRCQIEATSEIITGSSFDGLHASIKQLQPSILLMGAKGRSVEPFHLGGLTAKMVASSSVPVLIVKQPQIPKNIAVLVDAEFELENMISEATTWSEVLGGKLEIISAWKDVLSPMASWTILEHANPMFTFSANEKNQVLEALRKRIEDNSKDGVEVKVFATAERRVAEALKNKLTEDKVDMAIMKRHHKGALEKFFLGSETRRMLEIFEGNLIILPE